MMLVFLTVLVTSNIYLSRRIGWIFSLDNLRWLHVLFAVLPVFMIGGMIGFSNASSFSGSLMYQVASILTGVVLYLLMSFLLIDMVKLFVPLKPLIFGIISFSLTLLVSGYGIWNSYQTRLRTIEIPVKGLTEEKTILHMTDIHLGHFRARPFLEKLVSIGKPTEPDMVVITGDLFDGKIQLKKENLTPLKDFSVPVFFVEGNHDHYSGVVEIKQYLRETGVLVLQNEVEIYNGIQLVGLDHMRADAEAPRMHSIQNRATIQEVLDKLEIQSDIPSVLLHHSPDGVEYANAKNIDLYLSGHTHAGQLFPVTIMNDLIFKYNRGLSSFNGTSIFVSNGAGTFGPPMRVGTRSEVVLVKLISLN